jgi:hypothetical protein
LFLASSWISHVHMQILYECNFDSNTNGIDFECFTGALLVLSSDPLPLTNLPPTSAYSDVTSSRERERSLFDHPLYTYCSFISI